MRWIDYLETDRDAYKDFENYLQKQIEEHRKSLENSNYIESQLRFSQGCIATLRQILFILEDNKKESEDGTRTDQPRAGP